MKSNYQQIGAQGNSWLFKSLVSFFLFGIGGFFIAMNSLNPFLTKLLVSAGYLIAGLLSVCYSLSFQRHLLDLKYEPGMFASILNGILNHFGNFSLILGYHYDPQNPGIISIMVVGSSIMGTILSYFIFNEKLAVLDIAGLSICFSGLVIIGIYSISGSISSFLGFAYGLGALTCFAIRSLFSRYAERQGIDMFKSTIVSVFSEALTGFFNIGLFWIFLDVFQGAEQFWTSLIGGFFFGAGSIAINLAVMAGKIGPALVIGNCSGILQMVLDYLFRDIMPANGKLFGAGISIVGVFVLMLWKDLIGMK